MPDHNSLQITDEATACAAILMACQQADELMGGSANTAFLNTLSSRNVFIGSEPSVLLATALDYYERAGSSTALIDAAIGAVREQTRLPLFYHCLDLILANGVVTPKEHQVFQYLKARFRVDDDTAFEALEVLTVKNQL